MPKEVKSYRSATLHETLFTAGVGEIKKEIYTSGDGINKAIESITLEEGSNLVCVVVKDQAGKKVKLDVPLSNFKLLRE
jgi:hypothetical protein